MLRNRPSNPATVAFRVFRGTDRFQLSEDAEPVSPEALRETRFDDLPRLLEARIENIRDEIHAVELHLSRRLDIVEAKLDALPEELVRVLQTRHEP